MNARILHQLLYVGKYMLKWGFNTDAELLHNPTDIWPVKYLNQITETMKYVKQILQHR